MRRPPTDKPRKRSKWAAYNRRRAANLQADRELRLANRARRQAADEARLLAKYENTPAPSPPSSSPPLRIRLRLEVVGYGSHQITAHWNPVHRQWMPSARSILSGIAALLSRAPSIASPR